MTKDKALKLAIEAFENYRFELRHEIIEACKEALEQPAQEYVILDGIKYKKLYTYPHQWQGLTDDEIEQLIPDTTAFKCETPVDECVDFARAIEQALKEKNGK